MSKTKSKGSRGASKPEADLLTKTKDMGVTKSSKTAKSHSKDIAKTVAKKQEKLQKERKLKEPTPESSDSSESDDDSDSEMSGTELKSKIAPKGTGKSNGTVKAQPVDSDDSDDDSDIESPSSASSDDDVEEEEKAVKSDTKKADIVNKTKAAFNESDESDAPTDSDVSDDEKVKIKSTPLPKGKPQPTAKSQVSDEGSDSDSSESSDADSDESDAESNEEVKTNPQQKRKAEEDTSRPEPKKSKFGADDNVNTSSNLFVGQLSWNVDDEWLQREFEQFGELAGVRVVTERESGRSKGFGYVEFVKADDAAAALEAMNNTEIDGRRIRLDYSAPRQKPGNFQDRAQSRAKSFGDQTSPASDTLFVGNIAFDATQDAVTEAFSDYGTIMGVRLPTDRETGAPKGFGYVTFSSVEEATAALKGAQGTDVAGRPLRLDFSTPRPSNGDFNARGGRGGRGGGGRGGGRGGFGDRGGRGGRGGGRGGRGGSTNRGGFGDFSGRKTTF